jgi:hypothetical protein
MTDPPLLIHIGFPKTGSTWLQEDVFRDPASAIMLPWDNEPKSAFIHPDEFRFDPAAARAMFDGGFARARSAGRLPAISDEFLTGNPIIGLYVGRRCADRIHQVFPHGRILIVIREQKQIVLSAYREHVFICGWQTLPEFIGAPPLKADFMPICRLEFLEFDRLIAHYQQLFGLAQVLVLPFESLRADSAAFVKRIYDYAGAPTTPDARQPARRVGLRGGELAARRALNSLFAHHDVSVVRGRRRRHLARRLSGIAGAVTPRTLHERIESRLKEFLDDYIGERYAASNRRTSELIGIDLGALGYPVG